MAATAKAQRPALKLTTLNPIPDLIGKSADRALNLFINQDSAYDQSITDAFRTAAVFCHQT